MKKAGVNHPGNGKGVKNFISVIIPAHNEENVIAKAINSVLRSTYKKYEIIVTNDGSTDRTRQIVEHFTEQYPKKIRLLNYDTGHSPAFARNRAVEKAKGDILFFLDADDWVTENALENVKKAFEKYKKINFIVGNRKAFTPKNWRRIFVYYGMMKGKVTLKFLSSTRFDMPVDEKISITGACPYIMKTKSFLKMGKLNENLYYNEDVQFNLELQKRKIPRLISKKIIYYTDMGSQSKDFKRRCLITAKFNLKYPFKAIGPFLQILMFFVTFPIFYPILAFIFLLKTNDFLAGVLSPFIWVVRRVFGFAISCYIILRTYANLVN